jgi:hypothetical protein
LVEEALKAFGRINALITFGALPNSYSHTTLIKASVEHFAYKGDGVLINIVNKANTTNERLVFDAVSESQCMVNSVTVATDNLGNVWEGRNETYTTFFVDLFECMTHLITSDI